MRHTARTVDVITILALALCAACAGAPSISVDERDGFAHYRTWSWRARGASSVDAPKRYQSELDGELQGQIERELARRGFERAEGSADLHIGVALKVRRDVVKVFETGAIEQVASLSHSPSYEIQRVVERRKIEERSRFVLVATDAHSGKVVWRGAVEERIRGPVGPHVEQTITTLMNRFPPPASAMEAPAPSREHPSPRRTQFASKPAGGEAD